MATVINSFAIMGIDAYVVKTEIDTIFNKPVVSIIGLGDASIKESRDRIQSALEHCRLEFPKMKIVISLAPCDIKKSGSHFDLGIAIGLLIQTKQIEVYQDKIDLFGFVGELSLNGKLRPCSGVLPMVMEAAESGIKNIVVPRGNLREASLVKDINVFGFDTLEEVISFLEGTEEYNNLEDFKEEHVINTDYLIDFRDVQGQEEAIHYVTVAAAGGHNFLMSGTPGCGKSMIAKRIPTILPSMTEEEALEVTKIYSVAGLLKNRGRLVQERPYRAPHHNASTNSLIGGGNNALPGEISLAHNGVLFLDEIAEFNRRTLDALRQPMEDGVVTISRVKYTNTYPANFMLIAAMNPCPCGYYGTDKCHCTDYEVLKYRQKISGPILDRIDIQKTIQPVDFMKLSNDYSGTPSNELKERVERARRIQVERFKNIKNVNCNAQMTPSMLKEFCLLDEESIKILLKAFERYNFSARTYHKFLKVARTLADMEESTNIRSKDIAKALLCRDLEKEQAKMVAV